MNKSELIDKMAERNSLNKKQSTQIVNMIFDAMSDALVKGDHIEIRGFGSFTVREYGAYNGRNPRNGEITHVAKKRAAFFKVGKELKERVDRKKGF